MTKHLGVSYKPKYKRWTAQIRIAGVPTYLGSFDTFEQALEARLAAEKEHCPEKYAEPPKSLSVTEQTKVQVLNLLDNAEGGMLAKDVASELQITEALATSALEDLRGHEVYVSTWKPILGKPWEFLPVYEWGYRFDVQMPRPGPCENRTYQTRAEFIDKLKHAHETGAYKGARWSDVLGVQL